MNAAARVQLTGHGFTIAVALGDGPAVPTAGGAQYDEVSRPEREPLTDYTGDELARVDVPAFFDGHREQRDVWPEVAQILALCRGNDGARPPDFTASGPIPYSGMRFVMEPPEWGDGHRSAGGTLIRQALTLHLVQFVNPDVIKPSRRKGAKGPRTIKAKKGQTLIEIAAKYLHDASRAKEIGKLNGIKDIRKKLPAGRKIRLPK